MEVEEKDDRETICAELFEDVTGSLDDLAKGDGRLTHQPVHATLNQTFILPAWRGPHWKQKSLGDATEKTENTV